MRECKECTLCCTILGVREINKPPLQTCDHCDQGCKIYKTRPKECKDFDCLWLTGRIPEHLKPSQTHVMLSNLKMDLAKQGLEMVGEMVVVYPDPAYPNAYKEGKMKEYLNELLSVGIELVVVVGGEKQYKRWGKIDE